MVKLNKKNFMIGVVVGLAIVAGIVLTTRSAKGQTLDSALLDDAASRSSLQSENWSVTPSGYAQFQWTYNSFNDDVHGFEMDRVSIGLKGASKDGSSSFSIDGAFIEDGETFELENAWFRTSAFDMFDFRAGQFRPNVSFENGVSSGKLLTLDRSIVNSTFASSYSQGVEGTFDIGYVGVSAFIVNGWSETTFDYTTDPDSEYGMGIRATLSLLGDKPARTSYVQPTDDHLWLGGSLYFDDDRTVFITDVDGQWGRFGVAAAGAYADLDFMDDDSWAVNVTPSLMITDTITAYGRYEYGEMDSDDTLSIVTAGANVNLVGSAVRWTSEVGYTLDDLSGNWNTSGTSWNGSSVEDGEFIFSSGFTIVF